MEPIRTNNDVEGWHRWLSARAKLAKLHFYLLIDLLGNEAEKVITRLKLITQGAVLRVQIRLDRRVQ